MPEQTDLYGLLTVSELALMHNSPGDHSDNHSVKIRVIPPAKITTGLAIVSKINRRNGLRTKSSVYMVNVSTGDSSAETCCSGNVSFPYIVAW